MSPRPVNLPYYNRIDRIWHHVGLLSEKTRHTPADTSANRRRPQPPRHPAQGAPSPVSAPLSLVTSVNQLIYTRVVAITLFSFFTGWKPAPLPQNLFVGCTGILPVRPEIYLWMQINLKKFRPLYILPESAILFKWYEFKSPCGQGWIGLF
jgi:hypothetical protein